MEQAIIFARHGHSVANSLRVISNRPPCPYPLTADGRAQARALLAALQQRGHTITAIYTSPLTRAVETANIIAAQSGLAVAVADALREPDCGAIENRRDDQAWEEHARQTRAWAAGDLDYHLPGGESFRDVMARFIPFVAQAAQHHKTDRGAVLMISHGSVLTNMLPLILPNLPAAFARAHPIDNTAYIVAAATESGLRCRAWCGTPLD